MDNIQNFLRQNVDSKYAEFQRKIISNIKPDTILGVRTPIMRKFAKEIYKSGNYADFLNELPHRYFEENQLHSFIICEIKEFDKCILETEKFLPFVDNWATCDQLSPKVFKKYASELPAYILKWISDKKTYTIRFGIEMAMTYFLDENFNINLMKKIAEIRSDEYYVNMMIAWYFATALAKQWDKTIDFIKNHQLSDWVHNKTIQKARESYRITTEQKEYLKELKI